jgi:hypothetical protein
MVTTLNANAGAAVLGAGPAGEAYREIFRMMTIVRAFADGLTLGGAGGVSPVAVLGWAAYSFPLAEIGPEGPEETDRFSRVSIGQPCPGHEIIPYPFVSFPSIEFQGMNLVLNPWGATVAARVLNDPRMTKYACTRAAKLGILIPSLGASEAWFTSEYHLDATLTSLWVEACCGSPFVCGLIRSFQNVRGNLYRGLVAEANKGASL